MSVAACLIGDALARLPARPFDTHSHTGADIDGQTRRAEEQVATVARHDGRSVIFPFCVDGPYREENRRVGAEAAASGKRLVAFARIDPRDAPAAEAACALEEDGVRGFKLHPRAEAFALDHPGVDELLGVAASHRVPVLIHAGAGVGSFGPVVLELAARHRGCPLILAHAGISDLTWIHRHVPDHSNLFFDTAWLVPSDLRALFASVPPGRILFGSDAPYMDHDLLLALTLHCGLAAGLSDDALGLVVGGQLDALLGTGRAIDAGPHPLPSRAPGTAARVGALLAAAGGALMVGGTPEPALELAALAAGDDVVGALIDEARSAPDAALPAIVLALALAA
jgi:predicted TIM-barrel fold metal-dependent hydrolase